MCLLIFFVSQFDVGNPLDQREEMLTLLSACYTVYYVVMEYQVTYCEFQYFLNLIL